MRARASFTAPLGGLAALLLAAVATAPGGAAAQQEPGAEAQPGTGSGTGAEGADQGAEAPPDAQTPPDPQTLADIRQEIAVLSTTFQNLRRELSTTGAPDIAVGGASGLARLDAIEAELRRLTSQTEALAGRVERVAADGTNQIGDLQFRLCELTPDCDIAAVGMPEALGGADGAAPAPARAGPAAPMPGGDTPQLAVTEQADFDRARAALDEGRFGDAAQLFADFTETYTGGPLTGSAHYYRGEALFGAGDRAGAARAYLESFSGAPDSPEAPRALLRLGLTLGELGQAQEACVTLGEVTTRFPTSDASIEAQTARADLACS